MASTAGLRNDPYTPYSYTIAKAGVVNFTKQAAHDLARWNVRVNAIAPGPVYTDGAASERTTALGATTPMGRAAQPDDITGLVSFLASAKSGYVTGAVLAADGGRSAI